MSTGQKVVYTMYTLCAVFKTHGHKSMYLRLVVIRA